MSSSPKPGVPGIHGASSAESLPGGGSGFSPDARRSRLRVDSGKDDQLQLDFDKPAEGRADDWDLVRDVEPAFPAPIRPAQPKLSWD